MTPRHTARGIVVHDGKLLLMERWRPGLHYFSIPGGGIETGEQPEETVVREIREETGLQVTTGRQVLEMRDGETRHRMYLCQYVSGEPHLPADSPEARHATPDNRFQPGWVAIGDVARLPFTYWQPLQVPLVAGLTQGFSEQVIIVSAVESR